MLASRFPAGKDAGTLGYDINLILAPGDFGGILLGENRDFVLGSGGFYLQIPDKRVGVGNFFGVFEVFGLDLIRKTAVGGIVFEQMGPTGSRQGTGSIERREIDLVRMSFQPNPGGRAADTAKAINGKSGH